MKKIAVFIFIACAILSCNLSTPPKLNSIEASIPESSLGIYGMSSLIRITVFYDDGSNSQLTQTQIANCCLLQSNSPLIAIVENGKIITKKSELTEESIPVIITATLMRDLNDGTLLLNPVLDTFSFTLYNRIQENVWVAYSECWGGLSGESDEIYGNTTDFNYTDSNISVQMHIKNADYLSYYNKTLGPIQRWNMETLCYNSQWQRLDSSTWYAETNNPFHGIYCTKHQSTASNDHNYWIAQYGKKNQWINIDWSNYDIFHAAFKLASGNFRLYLQIEEDKQSIDGMTAAAFGVIAADKDINASWQVFEWSLKDFIINSQNKISFTKINAFDVHSIQWSNLTFYMDDMYVYHKAKENFIPYPSE